LPSSVLDDAALGGATPVEPKSISPTDPAARYTGAANALAVFEPHVKLMDKSEREDGTFSRSDFAFDPDRNLYVCPSGKELRKYHRAFSKPRDGLTKEAR
jgi:hypothetical protein